MNTESTPDVDVVLRDAYEAVPYQSHAIAESHPDRLAVVGMIFGMTPPLVTHARVLELGCASGMNIIPLAAALPDSSFVGVDFSASAVRAGQEMYRRLNLSNIEILERDITKLGGELGSFDYIICHGVYSWVSDAVKEQILNLCAASLTPSGLAYVSYNTLPGWTFRHLTRAIMLYHSKRFQDPKQVIEQSRAILQFVAEHAREPEYRGCLQRESRLIRGLTDWHLFHDHLERYNDALFFSEFMERAAVAGLQYVGDAELSSLVPQEFPRDVQTALAKLAGDIVAYEQYMDLLRNRYFRRTVLCRQEVSLRREFNVDDLRHLIFASPVRHQQSATEGDSFVHPSGSALRRPMPMLTAALRHLSNIWPRGATFDELLQRVRLQPAMDDHAEQLRTRAFSAALFKCCLAEVVELRTYERPLARDIAVRPRAFPAVRLQAEESEMVFNLLHQGVRLDSLSRELVKLLDGTRTFAELLRELQKHAGSPPPPQLEQRLDRMLAGLYGSALLQD